MLILLLSGCSKQSDCCTIIDTAVQIHYVNASGENLINSSEAFKEQNIKLYFRNGDEYEYAFQGNLDYPNMHYLSEGANGELILTVFPSNYYDGNLSTSLIEINESIVDTLVCEFDLGSNKEICTKAWLNGAEMQNRFIEVIK